MGKGIPGVLSDGGKDIPGIMRYGEDIPGLLIYWGGGGGEGEAFQG